MEDIKEETPELTETAVEPVPEKRKRGRPKGSTKPKPEESAEVPEETPLTPEESSPVAPTAPVVMKTRKPRVIAIPAAPAPPSAGDISDALLTAWEGRRNGGREAKKALYSSWM